MKLRIMSDLHLEFEIYLDNKRYASSSFSYFDVPETEDESDTVLILAGDIGRPSSPITIVPFIEEMCTRFREVLYVPGNHEFYGMSFLTAVGELKAMLGHTSCYVMDNDVIKIDDVNFIGSTLWTDFDKGNYLSMMRAKMSMNDYATIKTGTFSNPNMRALDPADLLSAHLNAKAFLESALYNAKIRDDEKAVMISHHLPTYASVHPQYRGDDGNGAYYSELGDMIAAYFPELVIHGHTHCSCDHMLQQSRIICNPRGYGRGKENPFFDPCFTVEV